MKTLFVALAAFMLAGCSTIAAQDPAQEWAWATATVVPTDPVDRSCVDRPAKKPRMSKGAKSKDEAARAYRNLSRHTDAVVRDYTLCQKWAQNQR